MLRFIARFLGLWLIAAALVVGVVDGTKSIAASAPVLTTFGETLQTVSAFANRRPAVAEAPEADDPLGAMESALLALPTLGVLAIPGALLFVFGSRRRRAFLSREFAA